MMSLRLMTAGCCLLAVAAGAAAPKNAAPKAASNSPTATYWMDVSTQSGMGAGATAGGQPDAASMMAMMSGQAPPYVHSLRLRLASKTAAPASPQADHMIPAGLNMGVSLPLVAPPRSSAEPGQYQPKGRMLIYWGCGEHVGAGQPTVIDMAQIASGKAPENIKRMAAAMGRSRFSYAGPTSAPGFGEWPNARDSRTVPPGGSLLGPHRIQANYSPTIDFTLGQGQDFMGPMLLSEGGIAPSGASLVRWGSVAGATGYALALFGATQTGDSIMWSSAKSGFANLDYLSPADAAKAVAAGEALSPATTQCLIPSEVAKAVPIGMVMGVAYGPEVHFAEAPKNPKWTVTVRYNSRGSLMRGMAGMMGGN